MQDLIRKQNDLALQREREIRADMKQLAASEARVAALEQQLQDQAQLKNPRGDTLSRREQAYFPDLPTKSQVRPWCPFPVMSDPYLTSVPAVVPSHDWYDLDLTPSSFDDTLYVAINLPAVMECRQTPRLCLLLKRERACRPLAGHSSR